MDENSEKKDSEKLIEERKEKISKFLKQKSNWIYYLILSLIVWLGVYIRTLNISKLKDITTGTWTLGPDLDPFLFLRWAKYIVENGSLMILDPMRYVPLGYDTSAEMKLLSYMIAWFHNALSFFSLTDSVTYSAIIFPVFMFALTIVVFFLFVKKIFYKEEEKIKNIIALISTLFFVLIPSLLPRTIAGIPEKESAALCFMFLSFYFFLEAFTSEKKGRYLIFSILAGISTAIMSLLWGGAGFIFMTITGATGFAFILNKIDKKRFYAYSLWILLSIILAIPFSSRFDIMATIISVTTTGAAIALVFVMFIDLYVIRKNIFKIKDSVEKKIKIPTPLLSLIITGLILIVLVIIFLGPNFIINEIKSVIGSTIKPLGGSRLLITVAENKQPYFTGEWKSDFGPLIYNIPIYFWLFFIGSIMMFNNLIKNLKNKERNILTFSYFLFLFCLIFSRYAPHPNLMDGEGNLSLLVYFGGVLFFIGNFFYFYIKKYKEGSFKDLEEINFTYILYFVILTLAVIGARGGIRLIMILAAVNPVTVAFLSVKITDKAIKVKEESTKFFTIGLAILIIGLMIFTAWNYYKIEKVNAENFAPGIYQYQWQKAMAWTRNNTQENAVFAHWWDYGYWVQSIGERATVLDGGNSIAYWDYLMGRYVLTGTNEKDTLEFLYSHNTTHLLIDSTEIGKYTAYSSIGSDENYDRFSWISTFTIDEASTQETKNETIYIYYGGYALDEDLIWEENGKEIFLPEKKSGVGGIIIRKNLQGELLQPEAIFVYNTQQYKIPLKYMYYNNRLYEFNSGLDAGIFIYPRLSQTNSQFTINDIGALFYLSKRTIHSNLARYYLFDEQSDYINLVHTESSPIIENLKSQGIQIGEFLEYQGFIGPIKIWEIKYPEDISLKEEYVLTDYPNQELSVADPERYN